MAELPAAPSEPSDVPLSQPDGRRTVGEVMAATDTDGWMVVQRGRMLAEHYFGGMTADTSHLLMSVSKSLVGDVAGALVGSGALDVDAP